MTEIFPESVSRRATCPWCGLLLKPALLLAVATSPSLPDDPVLGAGIPLRFLPSRFQPDGVPVDPGGTFCTHLACPHCRESFPLAGLFLERVDVEATPPLRDWFQGRLGNPAPNWPSIAMPAKPTSERPIAVVVLDGRLCRIISWHTDGPYVIDADPARETMRLVTRTGSKDTRRS